MCTFLALETFSTKKCGCFWQVRLTTELFFKNKPQQPAQTKRQTKTTAAVSAGPAKSLSPGLNLSTMRPMAAERAAPRKAAGKLAGRQVMGQAGSIKKTVPSYSWC